MTFPAYPDYKDSGVEWLGVVPEHWGVKPLRYLGRFRKGLTITKADLTDTGIPCLNYGEVHSLYPFEVNQDIQALKCVPVKYLETEPSSCISYGDFVFADTSEDLEGVGNFTHVSGLEPLFAGYHTIIYSLDSDVSSRFLAYYLESFAFRTQLRMGVKGVKVFSVTQEILRGGLACLPTTAEQTQIALFLDHETARIDALIEEQQRLIELLKEKRQAVIFHAVTKSLDPTVLMKDSGVEWLGEVPEHWDVVPTNYRYEIQLGRMLNEQRAQGDHLKPYLRVFDVQWNAINTTDLPLMDFPPEVQSMYRLKNGDLMVNEGGSYVGRSAIWRGDLDECYYQKALHRLRPRDVKRDTAEFFLHVMEMATQQGVFVAGGNQTTIDHLTAEQLRQYRFAFPPLQEQLQIAEKITEVVSKIQNTTSEAEELIGYLKERRSALISAAVTGKIDVRGWQPPVSAASPELEQEAV
jgi:type I restriction enzyme S subunit